MRQMRSRVRAYAGAGHVGATPLSARSDITTRRVLRIVGLEIGVVLCQSRKNYPEGKHLCHAAASIGCLGFGAALSDRRREFRGPTDLQHFLESMVGAPCRGGGPGEEANGLTG